MPTAIESLPRTTTLNVADHVVLHAATRPHAAALRFGRRTWSYAELDAEAARAANVLVALGARTGDRVALQLPNVPAFVVAYLGALRIGAVPVALPPSWRAETAASALADTAPVALITTAELHHRIAAIPEAPDIPTLLVGDGPDVRAGLSWEGALARARDSAALFRASPQSPASILYSSGTTATPKGVVLSHANVSTNARMKAEYCGLLPDDRVALVVPLSHCYGQNAVMNAALHAGACVVLSERFDAEAIVEQSDAGEVTVVFGVPPMFSRLLNTGSTAARALGRLRYVLSAATTLPASLAGRWQEETGLAMHEAYGLTESSPFAAYSHAGGRVPGSLGAPIRGVTMAVLDPESGEECRAGERGEIAIRGHNVMLGYWNRPDDTARALRGGWLRTGDVGFADERGHFHLVDRAADLVKVSGFRAFPSTVEAVLNAHPCVTESAAYGVMDESLGERIEAAVVVSPEWRGSSDELRAFCAMRLASYEVPSRVHVCRELPRSPTGKVLRSALRTASAHPCGLQHALDARALIPT